MLGDYARLRGVVIESNKTIMLYEYFDINYGEFNGICDAYFWEVQTSIAICVELFFKDLLILLISNLKDEDKHSLIVWINILNIINCIEMENQINPAYTRFNHLRADGVKSKYVYKHSTPIAIEDPPARKLYYSTKLKTDCEIVAKQKILKQLFRPCSNSYLNFSLKREETKNAFNYDDKRTLKPFLLGKEDAKILNELNSKRPIGNSPDAGYNEKLINEELISSIQTPDTRKFQVTTTPYQLYRHGNGRSDKHHQSTVAAYEFQYFNTDLGSLHTRSTSFAPPSNITSIQNFTVFEDSERTVTTTPEMSVDKMDEFSGYFYERPKIPFEF
uniref:Uncharacterized protein n=1 Tax=Glossina palpalis gambiensis TaxID=67801 RepID=A0A1B0B7V3_9MUSC